MLAGEAPARPAAAPRPNGAARKPPTPEPTAAVPEPAPPPEAVIGTVELHLFPEGASPAGLPALITLRPGAPLLKKEVRRTLERLWGTGRFSDVAVLASDGPDGRLTVVIDAQARIYVDRVELEGYKVLTESELRKALALPDQGMEYYPGSIEKMKARLKTAYQRVGYRGTQIEDKALLQDELGHKILPVKIIEGPPTRIDSINIAGDPQLSTEEILTTLGLSPGDILELDKLDKGMAALRERYRGEAHFKARFGPPEISEKDGRATILVPVTASAALDFRFKGNEAFDDAELRRRLAYNPEDPLDEMLLMQLQTRLVQFYRRSGFPDVKVHFGEVRGRDRKRTFVVFHIVEGAPLRVVSVSFEGNRHFDSRFLLDRLEESLEEATSDTGSDHDESGELFAAAPARQHSRFVAAPIAVWYEPAYQQALERIEKLYRADGYLRAKADPPLLEIDELRRQARVVVHLNEGLQTIVTDVAVPGAPDPAALLAVVLLKPGRPLNSLEEEDSKEAIQRALGHDGYVFANVVPEETFADKTETRVRVAFKVTTNKAVRVGRILVDGNSRTHESVVRGALSIEEGKLLDPEAMATSQRNLVRLGIFRSVTLTMDKPEVAEETKDVYVKVSERSTQSVEVGGGYSLVEGPRFFAEYTKSNLLGRALQLQARVKLNYFNLGYVALTSPGAQEDGLNALGRHLNLSLQYPRVLALLPLEAGIRLDLVHEFVNRPAYNFQRTAAILGGDLAGPYGINFGLAYEIEADDIGRKAGSSTIGLSQTDIERLRFDEGLIYLHSVRPTLSLDLRDSPANPHKGFMVSTTVEFVQSLGGAVKQPDGSERTPHSLFIKLTVGASVYIPLFKRAVLAISLKGGKVFPLDAQSETILPKRFFLGGANSMRGFSDDAMIAEDQIQGLHDQVRQCDALINKTGCSAKALAVREGNSLLSEGGEAFTLGRAELRFPIAGQVEGAFFFDTGNLWLDQSQFNFFNLRYAVGAGVRLVTPIGPAAFDLGVNLAPDRILNESIVVPHISIGLF